MEGKSNSVIDLMFLQYGSSELDYYSILPKSRLSSDHAPLLVNILIVEEIIQTSKLTLAPKSNQESNFIKDIISNFKSLNMTNIEDIGQLERPSTKLGEKMQKNQKFPNTPNNSGLISVKGLSTITGHQEVSKTGKSSRRLLKTLRDSSSMTKFKKLWTKVEAHGSWWTGSKEGNSLLSRLSTMTDIHVSPLTTYEMYSIVLSTLLWIAKLTSISLTK